jgi:hypothetical protein
MARAMTLFFLFINYAQSSADEASLGYDLILHELDTHSHDDHAN